MYGLTDMKAVKKKTNSQSKNLKFINQWRLGNRKN